MPGRLLTVVVSAVVGVMVLVAGPAAAQNQVSVNSLMHDILRMADTGPETQAMFMWFPTEVFVAMAQANPNTSAADVQAFKNVYSPYTAVAFSCLRANEDLTQDIIEPSTIKQNIVAIDTAGREQAPVEDIPPALSQILSILKLVARQGMGGAQVAESFDVVVFSNKSADGTQMADPTKRGEFAVKVTGVEGIPATPVTWHLPLDALMPPKYCSSCDEPVQHAWTYCPWCGAKLVE
ncbi:MAG: hypothetical protein ACLFWB_13710 [Armatimonadota bacterium]